MPVTTVSNLPELQATYQRVGAGLVVIDFYADWCPPCRMMSPIFDQYSAEFPEATFIKVNVDRSRDIAASFSVNAMPTFVFVQNKGEVDRLQGANATLLKTKIANWISYFASAAPTSAPAGATPAPASAPGPNAANPAERRFLEPLVAKSKAVQQHEDEISQTLALSLMPLEALQEKAKVNGEVNDFELVRLLLAWFKNEFFIWVDRPQCDRCGNVNPTGGRNVPPTAQEAEGGASRVEYYECEKCKAEGVISFVRFPRYNNPAKLLETREGRCGEWANCFLLILRAAGLEARHVVDDADHVWNEFYSRQLKRWVHCDPCENVIDTPLMYERGWGKKYAFVFAFAVDHITDVTWRYTFNRQNTSKLRRRVIRTAVLHNFLTKLNNRLQAGLPEERKAELRKRKIAETAGFLWPNNNLRTGAEAENHGRQSGSEEWRQCRTETGVNAPAFSGVIMRLTQKEIDSKTFELTYSCASDEYSRPGDEANPTIKGWKKLISSKENVFRKFENDWKMAYLARTDGSDTGKVAWKLDFGPARYDIESLSVSIGTPFTKEGGRVLATVCSGSQCVPIPADGKLELKDIAGAEYVEITANLLGGTFWQHAQLFRTDADDSAPSLRLRIRFKPHVP